MNTYRGTCYIVMDLLEGPPLVDALSELGGKYTER